MRLLISFLFLVNGFLLVAQPIKKKDDWGSDISDNCFMKNRVYLGISYGLPNQLKKNWSTFEKFGDYKSNNYGPLQLQIEYAFAKRMSVHLFGGALSGEASWVRSFADTNQQVKTKNIGFAYQALAIGGGLQPRIFYNKQVDVYLKGQLAYLNFKVENLVKPSAVYEFEKPTTIPNLQHYLGVGVRYFYKKRTAFSGEAGIGNAQILNLGWVYRLGL